MDRYFSESFIITLLAVRMLSREQGTRLTGRYIPMELSPFSFAEFLDFKGHTVPDLTRQKRVEMAQLQHFGSGAAAHHFIYPEAQSSEAARSPINSLFEPASQSMADHRSWIGIGNVSAHRRYMSARPVHRQLN
jgi:hypothetical protein